MNIIPYMMLTIRAPFVCIVKHTGGRIMCMVGGRHISVMYVISHSEGGGI